MANFPPKKNRVESALFTVGPKDFAFAETAGRVVGDAIRLVARTPRVGNSCIWPEKFEARVHGKYKVRVSASRFAPGSVAIPFFEGPMQLRVYAQPIENDERKTIGTMRKLTEFELISDKQTFECEVELRRTETPVLYFANALISRPTDHPPKDHLKTPTYETLIRNADAGHTAAGGLERC